MDRGRAWDVIVSVPSLLLLFFRLDDDFDIKLFIELVGAETCIPIAWPTAVH